MLKSRPTLNLLVETMWACSVPWILSAEIKNLTIKHLLNPKEQIMSLQNTQRPRNMKTTSLISDRGHFLSESLFQCLCTAFSCKSRKDTMSYGFIK